MIRRTTTYHVGTAGWEHDAFAGCLYPTTTVESIERLSYFARLFDAVEVRPSFWDDTLTPEDARRWMDAVADNKRFLFNIKLHSAFSHKREIKPRQTSTVRAILQELARNERLGALLMQFPYAFTNTSANKLHLIKLSEVFRGFPIHVELRHESWNTPKLIDYLAEHQLSLVQADLPRIRQMMPFITTVVGDRAYIRLHGRNERGWLLNGMDTRYDYLYNGREIREILRRLQGVAGRCSQVIVICNNTTGGKAVANALQLISALRGKDQAVLPTAAVAAFPFLDGLGRVEHAEDLFHAESYREAM